MDSDWQFAAAPWHIACFCNGRDIRFIHGTDTGEFKSKANLYSLFRSVREREREFEISHFAVDPSAALAYYSTVCSPTCALCSRNGALSWRVFSKHQHQLPHAYAIPLKAFVNNLRIIRLLRRHSGIPQKSCTTPLGPFVAEMLFVCGELLLLQMEIVTMALSFSLLLGNCEADSKTADTLLACTCTSNEPPPPQHFRSATRTQHAIVSITLPKTKL